MKKKYLCFEKELDPLFCMLNYFNVEASIILKISSLFVFVVVLLYLLFFGEFWFFMNLSFYEFYGNFYVFSFVLFFNTFGRIFSCVKILIDFDIMIYFVNKQRSSAVTNGSTHDTKSYTE